MTETARVKNYGVTNETVIARFLKRFEHSKDSRFGRKYCLQYFFQARYFGYKGHVFDVKKSDLIDYFDYLNHLKTLSLRTKINKWVNLCSFLQFVMEYYDGFVVVIPRMCVSWMPTHKEPDSNKDVVLTQEEVKRLLDYNQNWNYQYYLMIRLFAETGMRAGEFLSVNVEDVNEEQRFATVVGKTGRNAYYFSRGLARHLALYLKERATVETDCPALFLTNQKTRYARRSINNYIHHCAKRIGINKRVSTHTFRRTINTLRKKMGCPTEDRRILICHKVTDVNYQCYVKLNYDDYVKLYDKWNPYKNLQL